MDPAKCAILFWLMHSYLSCGGIAHGHRPSADVQVTLLSQPGCHLCEEAKAMLQQLSTTYPLTMQDINITNHAGLTRRYGDDLPVIFLNGCRVATYHINPALWLRDLRRARRRQRRVRA